MEFREIQAEKSRYLVPPGEGTIATSGQRSTGNSTEEEEDPS